MFFDKGNRDWDETYTGVTLTGFYTNILTLTGIPYKITGSLR